jgi:hypothetical protein
MHTTTHDRSHPSPTPAPPGGEAAVADLGTLDWVDRTGGQLSGAERRSLLGPVARTHAVNAAGRLSMLAGLNSGRRARVAPSLLVPPTSALTRAAAEHAQRRLSPALLNHSYRTFAFGAALGALEGRPVDAELLFAAALLHDTGLPTSDRDVDFTRNSARIARDVAEEVGLSSAASETMRTAITLHLSPNVPLARGPEAHLLAAGAGVDAVGLRSWQLPRTCSPRWSSSIPGSGSRASSPPRAAPRPPVCPAGECSSCVATAPSTSPSGSHRSAADPPPAAVSPPACGRGLPSVPPWT